MTPAQALVVAKQLHQRRDLDDAETLYERILALAPDNADALHFKGVLLHQRGRSEQALALIARSIELDASVPDWHYNLGNVLFETGRLDEAGAAYDRAAALAPERANIRYNIGVLRRQQGRLEEAEAAFRQAHALHPTHPNGLVSLGHVLYAMGRRDEAMRAYSEAVLLAPQKDTSRISLARANLSLGRRDEAARIYREWLAAEPDSVEARHYLAACSGEPAPPRCADAYVEKVFDSFAESFEAKLAFLQYHAPTLLAAAVGELVGAPRRALTMLDAGCGTGLCGPLLAPFAKRLDGVDLSAGMLAKAEPRQVYDSLVKAELTGFIEGVAPASYDVIVSADTLCYFGDLAGVTRAAAHALVPGGWLIFTVEALTDPADDAARFRLHDHGRYSHREGYLRSVVAEAGLALDAVRPAHLRTEAGKPVDGFVVSAQARATPA